MCNAQNQQLNLLLCGPVTLPTLQNYPFCFGTAKRCTDALLSQTQRISSGFLPMLSCVEVWLLAHKLLSLRSCKADADAVSSSGNGPSDPEKACFCLACFSEQKREICMVTDVRTFLALSSGFVMKNVLLVDRNWDQRW